MTPMTRISVGGTKRMVPLDAMIDTAFEGEVCVSLEAAVQLGLELIGTTWMELADGSQKRELLFAGSVRFLGETRPVEISLADSQDTLIGTRLMADCRLWVDFASGRVRLSRKPPRSRGSRVR